MGLFIFVPVPFIEIISNILMYIIIVLTRISGMLCLLESIEYHFIVSDIIFINKCSAPFTMCQ